MNVQLLTGNICIIPLLGNAYSQFFSQAAERLVQSKGDLKRQLEEFFDDPNISGKTFIALHL